MLACWSLSLKSVVARCGTYSSKPTSASCIRNGSGWHWVAEHGHGQLSRIHSAMSSHIERVAVLLDYNTVPSPPLLLRVQDQLNCRNTKIQKNTEIQWSLIINEFQMHNSQNTVSNARAVTSYCNSPKNHGVHCNLLSDRSLLLADASIFLAAVLELPKDHFIPNEVYYSAWVSN